MRPIDADELKKSIEEDEELKNNSLAYLLMNLMTCYIDDTPTIDAEPVRHGHWIKLTDSDGDYYCCSNCGEELPRYSCTFPTPTKPFPLMKSIDKTKRCPDCGAKMDEVIE